jgi:hypothetical protein
MRRIRFYYLWKGASYMRRIFWLFVMLLLVSCGIVPTVFSTPTAVTAITRDEAINIGLKVAYSGSFEILTLSVDPESGHAQLTTLSQAMKQVTGSETVARGDSPKALVWIVTFDGQWQDAFPRTTEMPTGEIFEHFTVIIDANNGGSFYVGATN